MLVVRGPLAHSHFRLERLLAHIHNLVPQINHLQAEFIHVINLEDKLTEEEDRILSTILPYGYYQSDTPIDPDNTVMVVFPKVGTTSAWSHKAIDILRFCSLNHIQKIERGIIYYFKAGEKLTWGDQQAIANLLHDPTRESVFHQILKVEGFFQKGKPKPLKRFDVLTKGIFALKKANAELALKFSETEISEQFNMFLKLQHNPSDIELMMFAKINWDQEYHASSIANENNSILKETNWAFFPDPLNHTYGAQLKQLETSISSSLMIHNTSIRLDGTLQSSATLKKAVKPKARFCGFNTLNLSIPGFVQAWEHHEMHAKEIPSSLEIMLEVPSAYAQFNNEFGLPTICGYFRTYEQWMLDSERSEGWGHFQPLVLSGGLAHIQRTDISSPTELTEMLFVLLGGPLVLMGLPSNSYIPHENSSSRLENAEMQRRCQEVINRCMELETKNPLFSIQSLENKGLGNTLTELLLTHQIGGHFDLADIPVADSTLSPLEIWCGKSQQSYILMITTSALETFNKVATRECCPFAVIGKVISAPEIQLFNQATNDFAVCMPIASLAKKSSTKPYKAFNEFSHPTRCKLDKISLDEAVPRLLRLPSIADKSFLIQNCDRTVTGLVARDPMVGPWQVAVADCGVTLADFETYQGEAIALGERSPLAVVDMLACARMALGEALTNIAAASINHLSDVRLITNWSSYHVPQQVQQLQQQLEAMVSDLGISLGIAIERDPTLGIHPRAKLHPALHEPLSVVIQALAPVNDVRLTLTPLLKLDQDTVLIFIDLSGGQQRLGQSALAQVFNQVWGEVPDVTDLKLLGSFFKVLQKLKEAKKILAFHDRSDGGLFVTLCEMAFASHVGLTIDISELGLNNKAILFNEELGAVIQVYEAELEATLAELEAEGILNNYVIGTLNQTDQISILANKEVIFIEERTRLQEMWSETSFQMQSLRDNPRCAKKQQEAIKDKEDPGLNVVLTFDPEEDITAPLLNVKAQPRVAILREQGTHSHVEMAAAFRKARFDCVDVQMSDLQAGLLTLEGFKGLAVCGGFSFGDVLGAGQGWANRILFNPNLRDQFEAFFHREDTFTLGLSNGCQMLTYLKALIPGAALWPTFINNYSEQFEARLSLVEIQKTNAILLADMEGSRLLVPVAHKEGRVKFSGEGAEEEILKQGLVALRYVDNWGRKTKTYPANPNGSALGMTGFTTLDGRVLIMMPHPDRAFRTAQYSWHPENWQEDAPWLRLFRNARKWVR